MAGMCCHMDHALGMEEVVGERVWQVVMRRLWKETSAQRHQTFPWAVSYLIEPSDILLRSLLLTNSLFHRRTLEIKGDIED